MSLELELEKAIEYTERYYSFIAGNRNIYIFNLAQNACKLGILQAIVIEHCVDKYVRSDFQRSEIVSTVNAAYKRSKSLFGKYSRILIAPEEKLEARIELLAQKAETVFENLEAKDKRVPLGFRRIYSHPYLESRGLTYLDFCNNVIGITNLESKYKDFVIFLIDPTTDLKLCKGFVARNTNKFSDKRYRNSSNADFDRLLYGFSNIDNTTNTLILVEGIFDKISVDHFLQENNDDTIKCCATFGKKITELQLQKLISTNVSNIILIYDQDAIEQLKTYGLRLRQYFKVYVNNTNEKDLGDSSYTDIVDIMNNLVPPDKYYMNKLSSFL